MKAKLLILCLVICMLISACGSPYPEMTAEEQEAITRYAAMQLIEHNRGYDNGITDITGYDFVDPDYIPPSPEPSLEPSPSAVPSENPKGSSEGDAGNEPVPVYESFSSFGSFLGIDGITISFSDMVKCDSYPLLEQDRYKKLDAPEGKQFLVLTFNLTNPGEEAVQCEFPLGVKYLIMNTEPILVADATYLEGDMSYYYEEIGAHSVKQTFLIFETTGDLNLTSQDLIIGVKYNGEYKQFTL